MPKKLEAELKREAKEKGLKGERADKYVYGTLRKTGWKPKKEKGEAITGVILVLFMLTSIAVGYFGGQESARTCLEAAKHKTNAQYQRGLDKCLGRQNG